MSRRTSRSKVSSRPRYRPLSDVLAGKDVISAAPDGSHIIVRESPRYQLQENGREEPRQRDFRELGSTGTTSWQYYDRFEYLAELRGHEAYRTLDKMRRGDGQVRKTLRLIKTPVVSGKWLVKPASDSEQDTEIAEFVWACLNEFMSSSFRQVLMDSLLMLDYGHATLEKVWETRTTRFGKKHVWKKLAPRHPADEYQWEFDRHGGPNGVWMWLPERSVGALGVLPRPRTTVPAGGEPYVWLPIRKIIVFTNDKEVGNIIGMSILRSAYKHWYMKDKLYLIDAIQKERHGIGIPVIQLPTAFNEEDRRLADEIGRNLRVNESAHVVLPPNWVLEYAEISGNPVDCLTSIEHHNDMISATILGDFLGPRGDANEISRDIFLQSARFVADAIADAFNHHAIPQLVDFNYSVDQYPRLMVKHIGDTVDQQKFSFGVRNLVGADLLRADDPLEDYLRELWELPARDPNSDRKEEQREFEAEQQQVQAEMEADQAEKDRQSQLQITKSRSAQTQQRGQKAGLPRQGAPSAKPPSKNAGTASNNPSTTRSPSSGPS